MFQGPLCPNLSQKVQKEVSQMANRNLSCVILLGGLSVNLNHLKTGKKKTKSRAQIEREELADKIINFANKEDHPVDLELAALSSKIKRKLPDPDYQDEIKDLAQSYFQICLPSMAPTQLEKSQCNLKPVSILLQSCCVGTGRYFSHRQSQIAWHT